MVDLPNTQQQLFIPPLLEVTTMLLVINIENSFTCNNFFSSSK